MAIGVMEVLLAKAKGLSDADFFGGMDPYVLIQYKGQKRKSSVSQGGGSNPVWNEKFVFSVEYPGSGYPYELTLNIMDKDVYTADDFVGQAIIYVEELLELGTENGSYELHTCKYNVVGQDQSYCGEIEVGLSFTLKEEDTEEEFGGWKESYY